VHVRTVPPGTSGIVRASARCANPRSGTRVVISSRSASRCNTTTGIVRVARIVRATVTALSTIVNVKRGTAGSTATCRRRAATASASAAIARLVRPVQRTVVPARRCAGMARAARRTAKPARLAPLTAARVRAVMANARSTPRVAAAVHLTVAPARCAVISCVRVTRRTARLRKRKRRTVATVQPTVAAVRVIAVSRRRQARQVRAAARIPGSLRVLARCPLSVAQRAGARSASRSPLPTVIWSAWHARR
jgi:hypothetical protein